MKKFILFLLLLSVALAAAGYWKYQKFLLQPLVFSPESKLFELNKGWSAKRLSQALVDKKILRNTLLFDIYLRISKQSNKLQAGEYLLISGTTPVDLLNLFTSGRVTGYKFTIIEGWSYKQLRQALSKNKELLHTLSGISDEQLMEKLNLAGVHPEGQFLPDTYIFPRGTSDVSFLKTANQALRKILDQEWKNRAPESPLSSAYEALILASIIEKETAKEVERKKIAGVFSLRLKKKMKLQTDPTVIYGMAENYHGNIRRRDLRTDTPYNTYTRKGLPPTPIAMPGHASIEAALHPEQGAELFFVSRGDGSHQFSVTVEAHNAAVRKYQLKK